MEALGTPLSSIDRYNDNTLSFAYLKYIILLQDFSVCAFLSLCPFGLVFLRVYTLGKAEKQNNNNNKKKKKKKKKKHKNNNNL